jgi:hypothetical protein
LDQFRVLIRKIICGVAAADKNTRMVGQFGSNLSLSPHSPSSRLILAMKGVHALLLDRRPFAENNDCTRCQVDEEKIRKEMAFQGKPIRTAMVTPHHFVVYRPCREKFSLRGTSDADA